MSMLTPALDLGSHLNAGHQARLAAEATQERTLEAVACTHAVLRLERPHSAPLTP